MNKIAVITGASRGIGLELCRQLASRDFTVVFTARNMLIGRPLVNELRKQFKKIWYHQLDVTDEQSILDLFGYLDGECGTVDVLINNAGIFLDYNISSMDVSMEIFRRTMETNVIGPLRLSQAMYPLLKKSEDGRIINLTSGLGQFAAMGGGSSAYRISKAALNALTLVMAHDLQGTNIKVNTVDPGWVRTAMGGPNANKSVEEGADSIVWLATAENIPNGKFILDRKVIEW